MKCPSPQSPSPTPWTPVTFPSALEVAPPPSHVLFNTLRLPPTTIGNFHSLKGITRLAETLKLSVEALDFAALEAAAQRAWNERSPAFSTTVTRESLNFLGRAFGGNIVEWHTRAALAAASQLGGSTRPYTHRVTRGSVSFSGPLFVGDRVRLFAEPMTTPSGSLLRVKPFTTTYRISLVVHRPSGFSEAPLSMLELGSSQLEVLHTPLLQDPTSRYQTLRGFDISPIVKNRYEWCEPTRFQVTPPHEGMVRRVSQLIAAADIRFYVEARDLLGGDTTREPIVTRDLSFEVLGRTYQEEAADAPLNFALTQVGESKRIFSNRFIKLEGALRSGETDLASAAATMVLIGKKHQ